VLVCVLLGACTQIGNKIGNNYRAELAPLLEQQQGNVDDVLVALGPPHRVARTGEGYAFLYHHFDIEEDQIGLGNEVPVLEWFKLSLASAEADALVTLMTFDLDDQLIAIGHVKDLEELGQGGSMMLNIMFTSIVDAERMILDPWAINHWGMSLAKPLPAALNTPNAPDDGDAGIELRGTPRGIGQRSLE
jgi:hypothetical protein